MHAKQYENSTMLSKVTAKNVGDVFSRHHCISCVFCFILHVLYYCEHGEVDLMGLKPNP